MIDKRTTFTLAEIAEVSGIKKKTIDGRYRIAWKAGRIPQGTKEFTYEQVKILLMQRARPKSRPVDPARMRILARQLDNDGIKIKKGGLTDGDISGD